MIRDRLRSLRLKAGYSQQQLANALQLDRSTYSYYELGKTTPSVSTLSALSKIFKMSVDELVKGDTLPDDSWDTVALFPNSEIKEKRIFDLSKEEKQIVCYYRLLDVKEKQKFLSFGASIIRERQLNKKDAESI